jgi:hypothetical protein
LEADMNDQHEPRRIREPRTGETPEPPQRARADDPTHGVDPRRDRPDPSRRPGLSRQPGQSAQKGAMQMAETSPRRRNIAPTLGLAVFIAALVVAAAFLFG